MAGKEPKEPKQGKEPKEKLIKLKVVKEKKQKTPNVRIRRPPNAFMLYGKDNRKQLSKSMPGVSNKEISKLLGVQWQRLPDERKADYHTKSKEMNDKHKLLNPGKYMIATSLITCY